MSRSLPVSSPTMHIADHLYGWHECTKCLIGKMAHKHVFYRGDVPCDLLLIGEAPGKTEDAVGQPFVGKSGKLLDEWLIEVRLILAELNLVAGSSHQPLPKFAITNTVCCRPMDRRGGPNRPPSLQESTRLRQSYELTA